MSLFSKSAIAAVIVLAGTAASYAAQATTTSNVNVRAGAGTNFPVISTLRAGTSIEIGDCRNGWCELVQKGRKAYVSQSLIRIGNKAPAPQQPNQQKPQQPQQPQQPRR